MTDTQVYSLKTKQPIPEPSTQVYSLKTKTRITNDDMVDEASLLTEEDMAQKTASGGGCATRKKACKDCSCGRAELEAKGIDIQPEDMPAGGCGSCAKGDAFRCATCPFLGKPAWKPGEKVQLTVEDDI
jgi:hypothetical protein|eukprot:CAMPEP_0174285082 /NCGR_PEP_ID=MMETSP0809-20121228/7548_1 /TAXON_ID=73025 ORGANISM="Eutreptiella gymnastica-like, Strain CCMP1594" /NCGR_SAMPLE_ID=MMETSP0809 /ASSEMBLY_ACC=CAM_ASM_000658 /LENGTH=128 /DNA_ID=CAMNT_0015380769 /DNA_START=29 /DNA_END=415 /DNA_ORIENTATION=+